MKIEDLKEGDAVYSLDEKSGEVFLDTIDQISMNKVPRILVLQTLSSTFLITEGHSILRKGMEFMPLAERDSARVLLGISVIGKPGKDVSVIKLQTVHQQVSVFNLRLRVGTNFVVGKEGIVCKSIPPVSKRE